MAEGLNSPKFNTFGQMKRVFTYTLLIITCVCLVFDMHNRWQGNNWKADVNADGYGYYAYLPCIFSLHSFNYERIIEEERQLRPEVTNEDARTCFPDLNGRRIDKFFAGESVLLVPFYLIACLVALLFGFDTNGYSLPFEIGVSIGALFYLLAGLIFLRKLLKEYNYSDTVISATILILMLGTNLLYYTTIEPSMSHVYSFSLIAIFLYYVKIFYKDSSLWIAVKAAAVFCLLLILRPTNINALAFVPFLAGDFNTLKTAFKKVVSPKILLSIVTISLLVLSIQCFIWKAETGHFLFWSYLGERFYFNAPEFLHFLFGFRNGWFLYTPLMFLMLVGGLLLLWRKSFYLFVTFLLSAFFVVYLLSSWYAWYYGGFGMRAMVDYYAVFGILLALCLSTFNKNIISRILLSVILGFLIFVNITQTRQYTNNILSNEYMNSTRYWKTFLRTDSKYVGQFDHPLPADIKFLEDYSYSNGFENNTWGIITA